MKPPPRHKIKAWRQFNRYTQEQVAEQISFDRSYYSRIENGQRPYDEALLESLAALYGCKPGDLLETDPGSGEELWTIIGRLAPTDRARLTEIARTLLTIPS